MLIEVDRWLIDTSICQFTLIHINQNGEYDMSYQWLQQLVCYVMLCYVCQYVMLKCTLKRKSVLKQHRYKYRGAILAPFRVRGTVLNLFLGENSTPLSIGCQNSTPRGAKLWTAKQHPQGCCFGTLFFLSVLLALRHSDRHPSSVEGCRFFFFANKYTIHFQNSDDTTRFTSGSQFRCSATINGFYLGDRLRSPGLWCWSGN